MFKTVTVPAGPPLVHPIPAIKAVVGKVLELVCPASGYPLDTVTWSRGGAALVAGPRVSLDPGAGRAEVRGVVAGDAGTYTCTATSRRGQTARAEAEVAVIGR